MQLLNSPGLDLIHGPMFSGKTSELLRKLSIYSSMDLKIVYINCVKDNRTDSSFSSHNLILPLPTNTISYKVDKIISHDDFQLYDVIGIDEAQFYPDLFDTVLELIEKHKKRVIVVGLDSDYNRKKFGQVLDLIPHADECTRLYSYCATCKDNNILKKALYTKLLKNATSNNNSMLINNPILIGGCTTYVATCRECYFK
jgi:thymidine kinase